MIICETDIERALDVFLCEAKIPRPPGWSFSMEKTWISNCLTPAFVKALEAIEPMDRCHGFDLTKIDVLAYRQRRNE